MKMSMIARTVTYNHKFSLKIYLNTNHPSMSSGGPKSLEKLLMTLVKMFSKWVFKKALKNPTFTARTRFTKRTV